MGMLVELKKISYCQKNYYEKFRDVIKDLNLKIYLCFYRIGINLHNSSIRGNARMWGDPNQTKPVIIHRYMSVNKINQQLSVLL